MFVAVIVNEAEPVDVGVPDTTPVVAFRVTPGGSAPLVTAKVGTGEPDAETVELYAVPTLAEGRVNVVIEGASSVEMTDTVLSSELLT